MSACGSRQKPAGRPARPGSSTTWWSAHPSRRGPASRRRLGRVSSARRRPAPGGDGLQGGGWLEVAHLDVEAEPVRQPGGELQVLAPAESVGVAGVELVDAVDVLPPARPALGVEDLVPDLLDGRLEAPGADEVMVGLSASSRVLCCEPAGASSDQLCREQGADGDWQHGQRQHDRICGGPRAARRCAFRHRP
jgi:hypothetical protein